MTQDHGPRSVPGGSRCMGGSNAWPMCTTLHAPAWRESEKTTESTPALKIAINAYLYAQTLRVPCPWATCRASGSEGRSLVCRPALCGRPCMYTVMLRFALFGNSTLQAHVSLPCIDMCHTVHLLCAGQHTGAACCHDRSSNITRVHPLARRCSCPAIQHSAPTAPTATAPTT